MKTEFATADTRIAVRVRTRREAAQVLEELRTAYQSLAADKRGEAKSLMADLSESQRRFGSARMAVRASWSDWRVNG